MKTDPTLELCLDKVTSEDKLRLIPALPQILEKGQPVEERHCLPGEDPYAKSYATFEAAVDLAGKPLTVRCLVRTCQDGSHSYDPMLDGPGPDGDGLNLWIVR